MKKFAIAAGLAAALMVPSIASAHVTLQPSEAPAGGFTRLDVRVPNEEDDAGTIKVDVQFPPGFAFGSTEPVPGWTAKITRTKLAKPIKTDDGEITETVSRITWTGDGKTGIVKPGEFQDFGLSVQIPGKAGDKLTFKALQTYEGGEVVRWIGAPDSEKPAPQVTVTAAEEDHHAAGAAEEEPAETGATPAAATTAAADHDDDDHSDHLAIAALIVGGLGLLLGGAGLATARKARAA